MINNFLDWYFSLPIEYPLFFLTCIPAIFSFYMRRTLEKNREIKKSFFWFIFGCGLIWFLVLFVTSKREFSAFYGNSKKIEFTSIQNNIISLIEIVIDNSGDSQKQIFRLQILNAETGERIDRKVLGANFNKIYQIDSKIFLLKITQENSIEYLSIINIFNLDELEKIDIDYFERTPLFPNGVQKIEFLSENIYKIIDKKGYTIYYNIVDKKIEYEINTNPKKISIYTIEPNQIKKDDKIIYELKGENRKSLWYTKENLFLNSHKEFLKPEFVHYNPISNDLLLLYYETLDDKVFTLGLFDKNFKEKWKWENDNKKLNQTQSYSEANTIFRSQEEKLLFNIGNEFYFLHINTGKLIWKNKL